MELRPLQAELIYQDNLWFLQYLALLPDHSLILPANVDQQKAMQEERLGGAYSA